MVLALEQPVSGESINCKTGDPGFGLRDFIARKLGCDQITLLSCERLDGGAVQENWRLEIAYDTDAGCREDRLVLRTEAKTSLPDSRPKAEEFALLRAAWDAGVRVAEPLWLCETPAVIGAAFLVSREVAGTARGRDITALERTGDGNPDLAASLGRELAKIHDMDFQEPQLGFLKRPDRSPAEDAIGHWRRELNTLQQSLPGVEWGLRWCEAHLPSAPAELCLVHGDFRTGNYLVDRAKDSRGELTAILDWEFAQLGDPMSDIGWFCAACWRFDRPELEAGGIGSRHSFYQAYQRASGRKIDPRSVRFWEVLAHIRWAVIACQQGHRFFEGGERSLDLALTGRLRPVQVQKLLLQMTAPDTWETPIQAMTDLTRIAAQQRKKKAMRRKLESRELLESAAALFANEIRPALPSGQSDNGRMIAEALACVLSDLRPGEEATPGRATGPSATDQGAANPETNAEAAHLALLQAIAEETGNSS